MRKFGRGLSEQKHSAPQVRDSLVAGDPGNEIRSWIHARVEASSATRRGGSLSLYAIMRGPCRTWKPCADSGLLEPSGLYPVPLLNRNERQGPITRDQWRSIYLPQFTLTVDLPDK